jgi:TetR/AcrR family transcriptional regulator, multidrug resistance operon repressor
MRSRDLDKELLVRQKAIESIVNEGLEAFSMNKLARACKVSVATLYIYYKDRDDLILSIAVDEGKQMGKAMLKGFDPNASFEAGLRLQWKNRCDYMLANPLISIFFEQLRSSSYQAKFLESFKAIFHGPIKQFMENAVKNGEIQKIPFEVYWSVAFAPLYALMRFHTEGQSVGGVPFEISEKVLWTTFDLVIKAFKIK